MTLDDALKELDKEEHQSRMFPSDFFRLRAATLMVENHELRAKLNKLELEKVKR